MKWTKPKRAPSDKALDPVEGQAKAYAEYTVKEATKVTVGFYKDSGCFASHASWGYTRGWEYIVNSTNEGLGLTSGDERPFKLSEISKVYVDPQTDKLYTVINSVSEDNGKWAVYVGEPKYSFQVLGSMDTAVKNRLVNLGVYIEYSKDGKTFQYVDYTVVSVRSEDDPNDGGDMNTSHWYYQVVEAKLPAGTQKVRVNLSYTTRNWKGSSADSMTSVMADNYNWDSGLVSVGIDGTPVATAATTKSSSSSIGSTTGGQTGDTTDDSTVSTDGAASSVSESTQGTASTTDVQQAGGQTSGFPAALVVSIGVVVALGAAAAVYFLLIRKHKGSSQES